MASEVMVSEGVANEGVASEGMASEGVASEGVANEGMASEGMASDAGSARSQDDGMCMCARVPCACAQLGSEGRWPSHSILSGTVPELRSVCEAKGGAAIGAGMPANGLSGTTIAADSSPPG